MPASLKNLELSLQSHISATLWSNFTILAPNKIGNNGDLNKKNCIKNKREFKKLLTFQIVGIIWATLYFPSRHPCSPRRKPDPWSMPLCFSDGKRAIYRVTFRAAPSYGIFQGLVVRTLVHSSLDQSKEGHFRMLSTRVSRIDAYGNSSHCSDDAQIRPICYCRDLLLLNRTHLFRWLLMYAMNSKILSWFAQ
jgi:hypothetical protein